MSSQTNSSTDLTLAEAIDDLNGRFKDLSYSLDGVAGLHEDLDGLQASMGVLADAHMIGAIAQFGSPEDRAWAVSELKWRYESQFADGALAQRPGKPPGLKFRGK